MKRIAVLISGSGSNLQALIDCPHLKGEIVFVASNRASAFGLHRAEQAGIETAVIPSSQSHILLQKLQSLNIDLIVLAGYLAIVPESITRVYKHRIINIHPSLIPAFCGKHFYGHHVHQAVYDSGVKFTGATTHFVDEGIDTGLIIDQRIVPIDNEDTVMCIAQKVLAMEHSLLVNTVQMFCEDKIKIMNNKVIMEN